MPIEGAVVSDVFAGGSGASTATGPDGSYSLAIDPDTLPFGAVGLRIEKDGYLPRCYPEPEILVLNNTCEDNGANVTGGEVIDFDATLLRPGRIQGTLRDSVHGPIFGSVGLFDATNDRRVGSASASFPSGSYSFNNVPPGDYKVMGTPVFSEFASEMYDDAYDPASADAITVAEGATVSPITIDFEVGGSISGRVTDAIGEPVPDTSVVAIPVSEVGAHVFVFDSSWIVQGGTDANGEYTIAGLGETGYVLFVMAYGGVFRPLYHPSTQTLEDAAVVTPSLGEMTTGIDIQATTPSGQVSVTDAGGVPVQSTVYACVAPAYATDGGSTCSDGTQAVHAEGTDASGVARLALPPGSYMLNPRDDSTFQHEPPVALTLGSGDFFECTFALGVSGSCTVTPVGGSSGDDDGVPEAVEDGAPNGGDGNGDGTPDSEQASVASLPASSIGTGYVTIAAPDGIDLSSVTVTDPPASTPLPPGASIDAGVIAYTVSPVPVGGTVDVEIHLSDGVSANSYLKLQDDQWVELPPAAFDIAGNVITLHLIDGGVGDEDGDANGTIVDPGAPAALDKTAPVVTCPAVPSVLFKATGATLTASVSDDGSGVASPTSTVPIATNVAGLRSVAVSAGDLAGNVASATCSYRVVYNVQWVVPLGGPSPRSALRDTVVPLTFRLTDAQGKAVTGAVVSAPTSVATACPSGAMPLMVSVPGSAVTAPLGGGVWLAGWKANKTWKGTCRLVSVPLADGTTPSLVIRVV